MNVLRILAFSAAATILTAGSGSANQTRTLASLRGHTFSSDFTLRFPDGTSSRLDGEAGACSLGAVFTPDGTYLLYSAAGSSCECVIHVFDLQEQTQRATVPAGPCGNRWSTLFVFTVGGNEYLLAAYPPTMNAARITIDNIATRRRVVDQHAWMLVDLTDDTGGIYYQEHVWNERRTPDPTDFKEKSFEELVRYDLLWIEPTQARSTITPTAERFRTAMRALDWQDLSSLIHPDGVRVSISSWVSDEDPVFTPEQVRNAERDTTRYFLGEADGSGYEVTGTVRDALEGYSRVRFEEADSIGYNEAIGSGNTINNIFESYPGSIVVEYYFAGDGHPMHWYSLRLAFTQEGDKWLLRGITNGYWTP